MASLCQMPELQVFKQYVDRPEPNAVIIKADYLNCFTIENHGLSNYVLHVHLYTSWCKCIQRSC